MWFCTLACTWVLEFGFDQTMQSQMMTCGCSRSEAFSRHLLVILLVSFSRQRRFKCLITVIPKAGWGVWSIPQRYQIPLEDFTFQSHFPTGSLLLKNLPRGFLSNSGLARGLCLFVVVLFSGNPEPKRKPLEVLSEVCFLKKEIVLWPPEIYFTAPYYTTALSHESIFSAKWIWRI